MDSGIVSISYQYLLQSSIAAKPTDRVLYADIVNDRLVVDAGFDSVHEMASVACVVVELVVNARYNAWEAGSNVGIAVAIDAACMNAGAGAAKTVVENLEFEKFAAENEEDRAA